MTYNLYSIRDVKTSFAAPFMDSNHESAKRGFYFAYANAPSLVNFSPADFSLYHIGYFDSDSGHITDCIPTFVCDATSFVKKVGDTVEE